MALPPVHSQTGDTILPDIGQLSYNGIIFSCLYTTKIDGKVINDNAGWAVKWMEYTLTVEGVVTLDEGQLTTDADWVRLRRQLDAQAGVLVYKDKGFGDVSLNTSTRGGQRDLNWGPRPKTLFFQPLGASRSARITWTVVFCISEVRLFGLKTDAKSLTSPVVQYNWERTLSYDEEGFTQTSVKGTVEIGITRNTALFDQRVAITIDSYRAAFASFVPDLTRFRVIKRHFTVSRDKRVMEFEVTSEELPYMGLPRWCTKATGNYSVRPFKQSPGIVKWVCTLRATYTVRKDMPRRTAWYCFINLLNVRMSACGKADFTSADGSILAPTAPTSFLTRVVAAPIGIITSPLETLGYWATELSGAVSAGALRTSPTKGTAILFNFAFDEGLYLDSRKTSFEASWYLVSPFAYLMVASGLWAKSGIEGGEQWKMSIKDIQGYRSWLYSLDDPATEAIFDISSD